MNDLEIGKWLMDMNLSRPLLIAGPCSAETEGQVMEIGKDLAGKGVDFFRAGIWKPRTRPGGFEGVGEIGLKWLTTMRSETGLKIATEVANRDHTRLALEYDLDMLWIGARTTVSPFVVQEIAEELEGTDKIVLVKNPVNPDLSLWIGAVERLVASGVKNIGVIHRGFSTYEKTMYRNNPQWQIPIDFQMKYPNIPIICDPSHIGGSRELIQPIAQTAYDLNFNGLMIETHCEPDSAWSDSFQQITPKRLNEIQRALKVRLKSYEEEGFNNRLRDLRREIDFVDEKLIDILIQRMSISDKIGSIKLENNVSILQNTRWNEVLERVVNLSENRGLNKDFITKIFKTIHQESIDRQEKRNGEKI